MLPDLSPPAQSTMLLLVPLVKFCNLFCRSDVLSCLSKTTIRLETCSSLHTAQLVQMHNMQQQYQPVQATISLDFQQAIMISACALDNRCRLTATSACTTVFIRRVSLKHTLALISLCVSASAISEGLRAGSSTWGKPPAGPPAPPSAWAGWNALFFSCLAEAFTTVDSGTEKRMEGAVVSKLSRKYVQVLFGHRDQILCTQRQAHVSDLSFFDFLLPVLSLGPFLGLYVRCLCKRHPFLSQSNLLYTTYSTRGLEQTHGTRHKISGSCGRHASYHLAREQDTSLS